MAESDLSISQMTQGNINTGSIIPGINPDQSSQTGYSNYAFTADNMANAFLNFLFPLKLDTESKSVFGAINELNGLKPIVQNNADRIAVLEKMAKGILYDFVTQTVEGAQNIPTGAHMADVQKLEGKSVVYNQLFNSDIVNKTTADGITVEKGNGNKIKITNNSRTTNYSSGSKRVGLVVDLILNHIYYLGSDTEGVGLASTSGVVTMMNVLYRASEPNLLIRIDKTYDFTTAHPIGDVTEAALSAIDLTKMFGDGNEPTLEECKMIFSDDYSYNAGELESANNTIMTIRGANSPQTIPLAFAGKSAGTVRDELDLVNKKYIQRVGAVDLGSLSWILSTSQTSIITQINAMAEPCKSVSNIELGNLLTKNYNTVRGNQASGTDNTICILNNTSIRIGILDSSVLNGEFLYYELAEPIITDVSTVIDSFEVEGGGSIEFDSSIPVKNTIEYLRYLNEVT